VAHCLLLLLLLLATLAWLKYTDLAGHWLEQRTAPVRSKHLDLTGAVRCSSQWPAKSVYFSHASVASNLTLLDQGVSNGQSL